MKKTVLKAYAGFLAVVVALFAPLMGSAMAVTITTTALDASYQAVYADGSKGLQDLHAQVFHGAEFDKLFTSIETEYSVYRQAVSTSGSVTQPGQISFTPSGSYSFKAAETPLFWVKAEYQGSSYKLRKTWLGSLHQKGVSEADQTFAKYIIDNHLVPQHIEDVELNGCYSGVYAAPTEGTAGAVGEMMNGFKKVINDKITATTVSPISTSTIPTDAVDFVTYIEEFVKDINKRDWKRPMNLAMNLEYEQLFKEGMEQKYNFNYRSAENLLTLKHFTNITVSGQVAMTGSDKIFCSPMSNLVHPYTVYEGQLVKFDVDIRTLRAWLDKDLGYGTIDDSRLYTNSEELPV